MTSSRESRIRSSGSANGVVNEQANEARARTHLRLFDLPIATNLLPLLLLTLKKWNKEWLSCLQEINNRINFKHTTKYSKTQNCGGWVDPWAWWDALQITKNTNQRILHKLLSTAEYASQLYHVPNENLGWSQPNHANAKNNNYNHLTSETNNFETNNRNNIHTSNSSEPNQQILISSLFSDQVLSFAFSTFVLSDYHSFVHFQCCLQFLRFVK